MSGRRKALFTDAWIPARTQEWGQAFGPLAQGPKSILVAFKVMIEADEEEFRKLGNVYKMNVAA